MKRVVNLVKNSWRYGIDLANRTLQVILDFWRKPIRRGSRVKMKIFKAELKSWMLGEFAPLKSKHDSGIAEANQQNLLNVIANKVKQSFLHCHCEPKARQSFQLHNNRLPRRYAPRNDGGRSMIEMLGVLAIIAVLSVGGIAGYSKAMEQFKINKAVSEYSYLIQGLLERSSEIYKLDNKTGLGDVAVSLNLIPKTWKKLDDNISFINQFGTYTSLFVDKNTLPVSGVWALEIWLAYSVDREYKYNRLQLCRAILNDLALPLNENVQLVRIFYGGTKDISYWGNFIGGKLCARKSDYKCLRELRPDEIENWCRSCTKNNTSRCAITLFF